MSFVADITAPQMHDSICSQAEFVEFANRIGKPIPLDCGSVVKTLRVSPTGEARSNTLSGRFGTGIFPFHTDTAFWPMPARFVLLRAVSGDLRRPTIITPFTTLGGTITQHQFRQSSWICDTGCRKTYTTMYFEQNGQSGLRYDPNCMTPANKAAQEIDELLRSRSFDIKGQMIEWRENRVAIIPNWIYLHARGSGCDDLNRIIERIYIY